jgi:hypothetical protein
MRLLSGGLDTGGCVIARGIVRGCRLSGKRPPQWLFPACDEID